jgi:ribosomal protein S19
LNITEGQSFKVHNGKALKKNKMSILHQLKKAGEFAFTRKPYFFPIKKKK